MENISLVEILKNMPIQERDKMLEETNKMINEKLGTMADQAAISVVKEEYR